MATGTIEFAAPIAGLRFEPFEVSNPHPAVEKIILKAQDDERLNIEFHLINVFDFEEATAIANPILHSIANRLAFYRNVPVGEPRFTGGTLPKDASGSSHMVRIDRLLMWDHAAPVLTLGKDTCQELARLLEKPYTDDHLYSAYRFAGNQKDRVACFMFLYNILLQLCGDVQQDVDKFIRHHDPNVDESLSGEPKKAAKGENETVYTRLRNEVGHWRTGTTPEQTRKEIEDNVTAFQELVRTAISRDV
jgi:hypothetical protein